MRNHWWPCPAQSLEGTEPSIWRAWPRNLNLEGKTLCFFTGKWSKRDITLRWHICCCSVAKSHVQHFVTPWTAAHQASLSFIISYSLPKLMSIESVRPSNHLILWHPLPLLPSIFPSIRVFSNGSALHIRWPKYWSFSFSISTCNEYSRLISLGCCC